jgi:hypothetical protein
MMGPEGLRQSSLSVLLKTSSQISFSQHKSAQREIAGSNIRHKDKTPDGKQTNILRKQLTVFLNTKNFRKT